MLYAPTSSVESCVVLLISSAGAFNILTVGVSAQQPTRKISGHILVVDDHDEWRPLLNAILSGEGHDVWLAASAERAIAIASSTTPDIVLLGLSQWELKSTKAAQHLRELSGFDTVPIILITSTTIPGNCRQSPAPLINGYINRNDVVTHLAECVQEYLTSASGG